MELESEINTLRIHIQEEQQDYLRKYSIMDRGRREMEQTIATLMKSKDRIEIKLNKEKYDLEVRLDELESENRHMQLEYNSYVEKTEKDKIS